MSDTPFPKVPEGATHTERSINGGTQHEFAMPNGYGASVVRHSFSYGASEGLWELAVIGPGGGLDYSTPITSDVEGWLTPVSVSGLLDRIAGLPVPVEVAS